MRSADDLTSERSVGFGEYILSICISLRFHYILIPSFCLPQNTWSSVHRQGRVPPPLSLFVLEAAASSLHPPPPPSNFTLCGMMQLVRSFLSPISPREIKLGWFGLRRKGAGIRPNQLTGFQIQISKSIRHADIVSDISISYWRILEEEHQLNRFFPFPNMCYWDWVKMRTVKSNGVSCPVSRVSGLWYQTTT